MLNCDLAEAPLINILQRNMLENAVCYALPVAHCLSADPSFEKKGPPPTQYFLSQFWSPNSKKYDFEITSLSPQEKMAHKWSKWLKNTLRVYIASEWLVFF